MKSLFQSIDCISLDNSFELQFQILGLTDGYKIIDKLECDEETKARLIKYTAHAYSYESPLLRRRKNRFDNKVNICNTIGLEMNGFVLECINNKNMTLNKYITYWLRESQDRDFSMLISAEDLLFDLLQTAREGVEKIVTAKDEKQAEKVMKSFSRMEVILKADAFDRAMGVKNKIESQTRDLEKNYQYLYGIVKDEIPETISGLNWAEKIVMRNKRT